MTAKESCLRKELSSWLGVCNGELLETACRWCSDEGVGKLSDIRDADAVSEFAEALSLDPADPRLLRLPSKWEIESSPLAVTCHQCALLWSSIWFRACEFVGVSKYRLCDECRHQCFLQDRKYGFISRLTPMQH